MPTLIDLTEWAEEPLIIHIHVYAAVLGLILGTFVFFRRKGTPRHRFWGRAFGGALAVVLVSSMFIHKIELWGIWSPIHLLTLLTAGLLIWAIRAVRAGQVARHGAIMEFIFLAGFVLAGALTLAPERMLFEVLIKPGVWWLSGHNVEIARRLGLILPALATLLVLGVYLRRAKRWLRRRSSASDAGPLAKT